MRDGVSAGDLTEGCHVRILAELSQRQTVSALRPAGLELALSPARALADVRRAEGWDGLQARFPTELRDARNISVTRSPGFTHNICLLLLLHCWCWLSADLWTADWLLLIDDINGAATVLDRAVVEVQHTVVLAPLVSHVPPEAGSSAGDVGDHQDPSILSPPLAWSSCWPGQHCQRMFLKTLVGLLGVILHHTELDLKEAEVVGVHDDLHINDISSLVGGGDDLVTKLAPGLVQPGGGVSDGVPADPALPLVPVPQYIVSWEGAMLSEIKILASYYKIITSAEDLIVREVHRVVIAISRKIFQKYLTYCCSPVSPPHGVPGWRLAHIAVTPDLTDESEAEINQQQHGLQSTEHLS